MNLHDILDVVRILPAPRNAAAGAAHALAHLVAVFFLAWGVSCLAAG